MSSFEQPEKIATNTSYLTLALIFQKILSFFYFAYIASQLGSDNLGKYSWALFFAGVFSLFIDFGLGPVLTREIARDKNRARRYLSNALTIKIIFSIIVLLALFLILGFLDRDEITNNLVYIAAGIVIFDTFTFSFWSIFRAFQILKYEAIGIAIYQMLIVILGVISIKTGLFLKALFFSILAGSIFHFIFSLTLLVRKAKIAPSLHLDRVLLKKILKIAAPFALAGIFVKINGTIDVVLLGIITEIKQVGWYTVASKLNSSLTFIPGAFATSFFPAMSAYFISSREKLAETFEKAMIYLMIVSLPITAGSIALADKIILKLYGPAFQSSIFAMQIIIIGLVFVFLNFPVGNLLNACNKQILNTINVGIAMAFNIIANLLIIPKYGYIGASYVSLITTVLLFLLGLPWVSRIAPYSQRLLFLKFLKILMVSFIMGVSIYILKNKINLILLLVLGGVGYFILLYFLKGYSKEDIKTIYHSALKK